MTERAGISVLSIGMGGWLHSENMKSVVHRKSQGSFVFWARRNTGRRLEILAEHGAKAIRFVPGWVAERGTGLQERRH